MNINSARPGAFEVIATRYQPFISPPHSEDAEKAWEDVEGVNTLTVNISACILLTVGSPALEATLSAAVSIYVKD